MSRNSISRGARCAASAVLLLAIAACGKSEAPPTAKTTAATPKAATGNDQDMSAEAVAKQARGRIDCPARLSLPARAETAPVDDVLGVRPGLRYDEAMNVVLCTNDLLVATSESGRGFDLKAPGARAIRQGFSARYAEPRVARTSKQIMADMQRDAMARGSNALREDLKPGQAKWFVGSMGAPGEERVLSAAREERFEAGKNPTVEAVLAALLKKYGPATMDRRAATDRLPMLQWARDAAGQLVPASSPLASRCQGAADPNAAVSVHPDCGVVVQALLIPLKTNLELVDRLQVGVLDHAGGYKLIATTETALGQSDQQRREQEVQNASKSAKAPTL